MNRKTTANSTYPKVAVQWLNQALCFYQSLFLADSEVLRSRHLRVAANRYDQKIEVTQAAKLYVEVFKQLFDLQPETFFTTDLAERITLTKNPKEGNPRQAVKINDTYFIEGNIDNIGKFDRMKHALTIFDSEDELIIKYSEEE